MSYKKITVILLALTTLPFFLLYSNLKFNLVSTNANLFVNQLISISGSIFGIIGAILLFWQVMLGTRFIVSRFSRDTVWYNKLHKKIGIYGSVFVFLHPMFEGLLNLNIPFYALRFNFSNTYNTYVSFGRIAFVLFLFIFVTSAILRSKIKYRPWLYIHYLAYPLLFFVLIHALQIGTFLNTYDLLKFMWYALITVFLLFSVYRFLKFLGVGSKKYLLINKEKLGTDIFIYTFKAEENYIIPKVGQYCYIQIKPMGEAHPFTVMEIDSKNNTLTFGIKAQGKFTNELSNLQKNSTVLIDGPYGVYTLEGHNSIPKVIIAGGIGVTPFVELVKKYGNEDTYMFYANRFLDISVKRDLFKESLKNRYYDVIDQQDAVGENVIKGFLTQDHLTKILPKTFFEKANFFVCGSKPFYMNYKKLLLNLGVPANKIYYEEFGL